MISSIGIAFVAGWAVLVEERNSVPRLSEHFADARRENLNPEFKKNSAASQSAVAAQLRTTNTSVNAEATATKSEPSNARLSRERFNAALAAGLIDPSRVEFIAESAVPALTSPLERSVAVSDPPATIQNPVPEEQPSAPVRNVVVANPASSPEADHPTKPIEAIYSPPSANDGLVGESPHQLDPPDSIGNGPSSLDRQKHRERSNLGERKRATRLAAAGIGSITTSSAWESVSRKKSSATGAKPDSSSDPKIAGRDAQSHDLSENLQRFASDFVRANQGDNAAEQHRFFADSVHFYGEGDLSLASVEAATRRHHRDEQAKRSEVAEPGAATGPVNGGFFEITQPVRWTQSKGKQVTRGRSVLRLRVVPVDHGGWKITSIDELNR